MSTNYLILAEVILIIISLGLFFWWEFRELRKYKTGGKTNKEKDACTKDGVMAP